MNAAPLKLPVFLTLVAVFTANAAPVLPEPRLPLVKRAPSQSTWTVEWTSPAEPQEKPSGKARNDTVRIIVQKDGSTLREQAFTQTGQVLERWILAGQEFVQKEGRFIYVPPTDEATDHFDYQNADFPRMEWVDMQYYCGAAVYEGVPVYLFIRSASKSEPIKDIPAAVARCIKEGVPFVLLSAKQLPFQYFDGRIVGRFSDFGPLKGKLEPSASLAGMGKQLGEDLKEHRRKPSPP